MFNFYHEEDQAQREQAGIEAYHDHLEPEDPLYYIGILDGIRYVVPDKDPWNNSDAYRKGYLEGYAGLLDRRYGNKKRPDMPTIDDDNEPF